MAESIRDVLKNPFKERLAQGEIVTTLSIRVFGSIEIVHIAKACGFDAIYIDLQHSSLSVETTSRLSIAALAVGVTPIVRVPTYGPEYIGRVLDGGAMGVLAPHVDTVEAAQTIVSMCRFPPQGERSTGGGMPHLMYRNFPEQELMEAFNDTTTVLVGSSRVDLQACKLEYSIVSPK